MTVTKQQYFDNSILKTPKSLRKKIALIGNLRCSARRMRILTAFSWFAHQRCRVFAMLASTSLYRAQA